ncbi:MAG: hypothetical protein KGH62_05870, partial [Candidatus Micrarchaeota archaeon]|nr:hypothetical protein [Candidatus Micrarchaeota archaeon]
MGNVARLIINADDFGYSKFFNQGILEMMDAGERLEVWLDAGEPIKNVPLSLKNDGHKLLL